ncbi:hypothetical protein SB6411_03196 [Klebsiella spallanzanii]|uniref:Uncharacterized protein n=1 Tax=Klebsiella spallanzanii TaxID=2587528 RepID=A0ABY6VJ96_9ENTR|nr:hypothetical protein SB6411_03196 [Klebsiella spallanzanii]
MGWEKCSGIWRSYLGGYRKYFKFSGRSGRKEFGVFFVITQVIGAILVALVFELGFPPIITTIFAVYVFFYCNSSYSC